MTTKVMHHRILLPRVSMPGLLHSVTASEPMEDLYMLEDKHMSQNPAIQLSSYMPNREHRDSCIGNDQMILSAVIHEKDIPCILKKVLPSVWEDIVEHIFKDGKEDYDRLQNWFEAVLNGSTKEDDFRKINMSQLSNHCYIPQQ